MSEPYRQKRKDKVYLAYAAGIFDGRDEKIRARKESLVVLSKTQLCLCPLTMQLHTIQAGTRAFCESAVVDGTWGRFYVCLRCLDEYFDAEGIGN